MKTSPIVALIALGSWGVQHPAASLDRDAAIRVFHERVDAYAALHRRLETPLLALTRTRDMRRNFVARQLLANSIRKSRARAQPGDIFSPDVAIALRAIIDEALSGRDVESLLAALNEEHPQPHDLRVAVNEPLPRGATHEMPVVLLMVLPALPEDVEYRIVNHDLVLWDIHADLVVDYLLNAFRRVETENFAGRSGKIRVAARSRTRFLQNAADITTYIAGMHVADRMIKADQEVAGADRPRNCLRGASTLHPGRRRVSRDAGSQLDDSPGMPPLEYR